MTNKSIQQSAILIVLDGWGYRQDHHNNAIFEAKTPNFDRLWRDNPHSLLKASGEAVGLPAGQMGNSEVGHITIGAGKKLDTDLVRINRHVEEGLLKDNPTLINLFSHVKKYDSTLHLVGLIGDGGVHAHDDHLFGILLAAKHHGITKIAIHVFTDGRDTAPKSAGKFLRSIEERLSEIGIGFIASATGRFYAMDRDNNWDRIKKAEDAIFSGIGNGLESRKPSEVVEELYEHGITDEHIDPIVFLDQENKHYKVEKNDGVCYFNFRADRSRQFSQKIIERKESLNLFFATLTQYDSDLKSEVIFEPENIETTLAAEISKAGLGQVHIAETEKFAHATYYLNGGRKEPHKNERHVLIDSRKDVSTHDQAPEMKSAEISTEACDQIEQKMPFIFINFANADMVGHTGNKQAIIKAVESVDLALGKVVESAIKKDYAVFITADHGNAEINLDENNEPHTAHTTNEVPAILVGFKGTLKNGTLADVAPTLLELFGLEIPKSMNGQILLKI